MGGASFLASAIKNGCETLVDPQAAKTLTMYWPKLKVTAFLATVIVSCLVAIVAAADDDQPVYFSLMVSSAPALDTSRLVSSVDQALQLIDNDTTVLPGYNLQYSQVLDTQVRSRESF